MPPESFRLSLGAKGEAGAVGDLEGLLRLAPAPFVAADRGADREAVRSWSG